MSVVVFCGPTISSDEVARYLVADVRPPVQRGDVMRAALDRPDALAIVDGYFDRVPSVWHKEILWAMAQGVHVFGAGSMGALRAAELASFGMVGVGAIFEAFLVGQLEDDDEVAVAHGGADTGYRLASEAMVNIRWTLRAAEEQGVIGASTRAALEARAKALPYEERDLRIVLRPLTVADLASSEISRLQVWLTRGRVDRKRLDAIAMLERISGFERQGWPKQIVDFRIAETDALNTLRERITGDRTRGEGPFAAAVEDELRARGMWGRTMVAAMMRLLATDRMQRTGEALNARAVESWIDDFRRERELYSASSFDAWLDEADLDGEEMEAFFRREAVVRATRAELRSALAPAVKDELRANGLLRQLSASAERKKAILSDRNLASPSLEDAGVDDAGLWTWFFRDRLRIPVPLSISTYAAQEGTSVAELRASALREFVFARLGHTMVDELTFP